jgi:hypothetical protein
MSRKSDEEVLRTKDDLEIMRRRHLWPGGLNSICLKNPSLAERENGIPAFAVLFFFESKEYYFLPELDKKKVRTGGDELLRTLIKEGWLID